MKLDPNPPILSADSSANLLDPVDVINTMIDLRAQLAELEQQVQTPSLPSTLTVLRSTLTKLNSERASISRRLSPGKWDQ